MREHGDKVVREMGTKDVREIGARMREIGTKL